MIYPSPLLCGAARPPGIPLPEGTVFKQGGLAPRHRAATTAAAAAVVITLGVAREAQASSRHDEPWERKKDT